MDSGDGTTGSPEPYPVGFRGEAYSLWCPTHPKFWGDSLHARCPECGYQTYEETIVSVWNCPGCDYKSDVTPSHICSNYQLPPRHPLSARFHEIISELGALHDKKQADYGRDDDPFANVRGSEDFGVPAWVGAMVRLNDKVRRLQKAARGGQLVNESVVDSFNDLAVYAVIARILYEEEHENG